jgi:hypothetical protein
MRVSTLLGFKINYISCILSHEDKSKSVPTILEIKITVKFTIITGDFGDNWEITLN